eukprot:scaffold4086_cov129-Isochrysis_galbana.AAC.2
MQRGSLSKTLLVALLQLVALKRIRVHQRHTERGALSHATPRTSKAEETAHGPPRLVSRLGGVQASS